MPKLYAADPSGRFTIYNGDASETLATLPDNSLDALITDPPAGIGFMGKEWDSNKGGRVQWIDWLSEVMAYAYLALKPGAHGLVWALPRTSHWTMTALENAGFEIRDVIYHLFANGFPKYKKGDLAVSEEALKYASASTIDASAFVGTGTALKPAAENWILVRKPLEGTIGANVLKWGTGLLDYRGTRVGTRKMPAQVRGQAVIGTFERDSMTTPEREGSFPAHVILDPSVEEVAANLTKFFYVPKPSSKERDLGLDSLPAKTGGELTERTDGSKGLSNPRAGAGRNGNRKNHHPTVKPIELMRYFVRLITPQGGIILDPFMGSGSTMCGAMLEGRSAIGVDENSDYCEIAMLRTKAALGLT